MTTYNAKQLEVISKLNTNILLLALAGTGKTKTLAQRIANIIDQGKALPEEILCLTFTNRACKEMRDRIAAVVGAPGLKVTVKTFHSFCFDIIKSEAKRLTDISHDFLIYDEEDCKEVLAEVAKELGNPFKSAALQRVVDWLKLQSLLKEPIQESKIRELCVDDNYRTDEAMAQFFLSHSQKLLALYNRMLVDRRALDFNDLLLRANDLLQNEEVLCRWRTRYKHIHIDEVQDTSMAEYSILSRLFHTNTIVLCGDYFQTIYEWRGSKPQLIINRFQKEHHPTTIIFEENYRSTSKLLGASMGYLDEAFTSEIRRTYGSNVTPRASDEGTNIAVKRAATVKDEARWIIDNLLALGPEALGRTAILTRNNRINSEISAELDSINKGLNRGLSFMVVDDFKFFRRQEIKDIIAYLKLIANPHDTNSCKRILLRFGKRIGQQTIEAIETQRSVGVSLADFLDEHTATHGDPYQPLLHHLSAGNVVIFDTETTGTNTAEDEIIQLAAVKVNAKGEITERFRKYLKPSKPVGLSQLVHKITDEYLANNGQNPATVLVEFGHFMKGCVLVGHNVGFDHSILASQLNRLGLPPLNIEGQYDTLDMARRFYPEMPNHKLETLAQCLEASFQPTHNALTDVLATRDVLFKMVQSKLLPLQNARMDTYRRHIKLFQSIRTDILELRKASTTCRPTELIKDIIRRSQITTLYAKEERRLQHIREFVEIVTSFERPELCCQDALTEILRITSLSNSELDRLTEKYARIPIITVHQAKGAEFDNVFLAGLQEYIFPSYMAIKNNTLEEEKRTFYVAITRAKKKLFLSWARIDAQGKTKDRSRFVAHIPAQFISEM